MKRLKYFLVSCLVFWTLYLDAQIIEVSGNISENTVWSADTVKIVGDVSVDTGVILTVTPGVYIEAQGYYKLNVFGGIRAIGGPDDTITFSVFDTTGFWQDTNSVAGGWPGIYIIGEEDNTDSSIFSYCKIQYGKNYDAYGGDINGGALYVFEYHYLHINHSLFENNMVICYVSGTDGPFGGAIFCQGVDRILIDSNLFIKNRSFDQGGAIRISRQCKHTTIIHNRFIHNSGFFYRDLPPPWGGSIGGGGGAISSSSNMSINSPEIIGNYCFNNKGLNGIIYSSNGYARIFNNVICNNWGSGIVDGHSQSISRFFNNTIINNKTRHGGIWLYSHAQLYNNICWGNKYYENEMYDQIYIDVFGNPDLEYNCVEYGEGGEGAIYEYPEFVNPTENIGPEDGSDTADWSLLDYSPCINAGTPDTNGLKIPDYDIEGNQRVFGNRIDIGAFENQVVWVSQNEIELADEPIKIYPNPASSLLIVSVNSLVETREYELKIYDAFGREIEKIMISKNKKQVTFDVSDWKSGMYFAVLTSSNQILQKARFIVN